MVDSALTDFNHEARHLPCFLLKTLQNENGILVNSVYDPPRHVVIVDSQFMAARPDRWQRSRSGHGEALTILELS